MILPAQLESLHDLARASDDIAPDHRDAAEAALAEIDLLRGAMVELAQAGQQLLAAAKLGERSFWNAANAMRAAINRAKTITGEA